MLIIFTLLINLAHGFSNTYEALLKTHVQSTGLVDYAALQKSNSASILIELANAPAPKSKEAKLAFWINAYNALTLQLIASEYPLKSIRDLDDGKVWSTRTFQVAGQQVTLDAIEHQILRPLKEPRIHAAINCASLGCAQLWNQPYTAKDIDNQLDAAMQRWMSSSAYHLTDDQIQISNIFIWFQEDFVAPASKEYPAYAKERWGALFVLEHYTSDDRLKRAIAEGRPLKAAPYDWSLNRL